MHLHLFIYLFFTSCLLPSVYCFVHPGVKTSELQLSYAKEQILQHVEPFNTAFYGKFYQASLYKTKNVILPLGPPSNGIIECGYSSKPDIGCGNADQDSVLAYAQVLMWYINSDQAHAQNAIRLINSYSYNLTNFIGGNGKLQAAWTTQMFIKAAEVLRHSNASWSNADIAQFESMLTRIVVPLLYKGSSSSEGNWEFTYADALIGIAVFTDNQTLFDRAITIWNERIPAYLYNYELDGNEARRPPRGGYNWWGHIIFNQSTSGICQETCRDIGHTMMGIASMIHLAETAFIQGVDLFTPNLHRITTALEYNAQVILHGHDRTIQCTNATNPKWETWNWIASFEMAYNAYHNRLGVSLPKTNEFLLMMRNHEDWWRTTGDKHTTAFETITHGGTPAELISTPAPTTKPTTKPTSAPTTPPTSKPTPKPTTPPTHKPTPAPTSKPTSEPTPTPTPAPGAGLRAEYYNGTSFNTFVGVRTDKRINFAWGTGGPAYPSGVGVDQFSIRWSGFVKALQTEIYTFYVTSDDGARVWLSDELIINHWTSHSASTRIANVSMISGEKYPIVLEYFDNLGQAVISLEWSSPSISRQVIPETQLYRP